MHEITLSFVIPAYNEDKEIGETLSSLINGIEQLNFAAEILVVDNGSTDRTVGICKAFGEPVKVLVVAAAISGYLSIGFLLRFLERHGTDVFSYYRIALGALIFYTLA